MRFLPSAFAALNSYRQFIICKLIPSSGRPGKMDKIPLNPVTGFATNPHEPSIWISAQDAITEADKRGKGFGVGFVFTKNDPFWFLDIDNCLTENNEWNTIATHLVTAFKGAAIEISSSKRGLHIFGTGTVPPHACTNKIHQLEFYTDNRFVMLTGDSASGDITRDCSYLMPWLVDNYFNPSLAQTGIPAQWTNEPVPQWNGTNNDDELIGRMLRSQGAKSIFNGGVSFSDLWEANADVLKQAYPDKYRNRQYDESSADEALALHLAFWTGNNCERIKRLMLRSKLVREKWERDRYLQLTILSACSLKKEWLNDKPVEKNNNVAAEKSAVKQKLTTGNTFLTIEQQQEHFAGCTYICDIHRVLVPGGRLLKPDQFKVMYGGYSFPMDAANEKVSRNAWDAFVDSQALRKPICDSSCFKPSLNPGEIFNESGQTLVNTWWPIITPRSKGDATPFLNHLKKLLPHERDQIILLSYLAALVQHQGVKFRWAPLLQGVEGNGKSILLVCVARAIGYRYSHFPKASEISTKFNTWMQGKIFIGVEDIYIPDSQREVLEALKPMITSDYQAIEPKGVDQTTVEVCCNFILNSNHKDGVRKTRNNRIFAPFYTAQQSYEDLQRDGMLTDYFPILTNWLKKDGYAIVTDLLYSYDIPDEFNPATSCQRSPITSSTEDAIKNSLGTTEQEIAEAIYQGALGFKNGWISSIMLDRLLTSLKANRHIPHNRRGEVLHSLGYVLHPHLKEGRTNTIVLPDGGKPRLYVRVDSPYLHIVSAADIARTYADDQLL